jgi:hypothetical protein
MDGRYLSGTSAPAPASGMATSRYTSGFSSSPLEGSVRGHDGQGSADCEPALAAASSFRGTQAMPVVPAASVMNRRRERCFMCFSREALSLRGGTDMLRLDRKRGTRLAFASDRRQALRLAVGRDRT